MKKIGAKIFIGGLPLHLKENRLTQYLSHFGEINNLSISKDPSTGLSKGYGFANFSNSRDATRLINHGEHWLDGRRLDCQLAIEKPKKKQYQENLKQRKLFVRGLAPETSSQDMVAYFSQFSSMRTAYVIQDHQNEFCRGYGYVVFGDPKIAQVVLDLETHLIGNREATCVKFKRRNEKNSTNQKNEGSDEKMKKVENSNKGKKGKWNKKKNKKNIKKIFKPLQKNVKEKSPKKKVEDNFYTPPSEKGNDQKNYFEKNSNLAFEKNFNPAKDFLELEIKVKYIPTGLNDNSHFGYIPYNHSFFPSNAPEHLIEQRLPDQNTFQNRENLDCFPQNPQFQPEFNNMQNRSKFSLRPKRFYKLEHLGGVGFKTKTIKLEKGKKNISVEFLHFKAPRKYLDKKMNHRRGARNFLRKNKP